MQRLSKQEARIKAYLFGFATAMLVALENAITAHFARPHMPVVPMLFVFPLLGGIVVSLSLFLIFSTGKVFPTRRLLFSFFTLITIVAWGAAVIGKLGTLLEPQNITLIKGKPVLPDGRYFMRPPPCPIAAAYVAPAYFLRGLMPYPTTPGFLIGIFLYWLISVLLFGRAFCSWLCPFGGIDDFFSQLSKRARLSLKNLEREWLNYRMVFFFLLVGGAVLLGKAIFDEWICPIQAFYTPPMVHNSKGIFKAFVITGGALIFLVVLPILTKKRFFCTYLCPLGGINGYFGVLSPFQVKKDHARCIGCLECERKCPLLVKFNAQGFKGDLMADCTRCGECIDVCDDRALSYSIGMGGVQANTFVIGLLTLCLVNAMVYTASGAPALVLHYLGSWN